VSLSTTACLMEPTPEQLDRATTALYPFVTQWIEEL